MTVRVVSGTANEPLGAAVAQHLGVALTQCDVVRFPDGELRPAVSEIRGGDVYVVQPTGPSVNDQLVELLLLLDACRRAGADRVTAVVPYYGYARQDRRTTAGEAVGARVVADALAAVGADRLVVVDPHTTALESMSARPVEMLTAVPVLTEVLRPDLDESAVVVAPDLGAVKLAERYATSLRRTVAVVRKTRLDGATVEAQELVGDVESRPTVIVDDMISTGGTIEAAIDVVRQAGGLDDVTVVATHGVLVDGALERMSARGLRRLVITDTLDIPPAPRLEVSSVGGLLADAVDRLHNDQPLEDVLLNV